ncbi:MAG: mandelate racemase [Rhizobiales bacterium]|nr:mandelate racemase [Hyphomicrobiales bacterium]
MSANPRPSVALGARWLSYEAGYGVHTATSGPIGGLRAVYLTLDYGDVRGQGEVRTNIAYLNGLDQAEIEKEIADKVPRVRLTDRPGEDRAGLDARLGTASTGVRLLLELALADAEAKRAATSVAGMMGAEPGPLASTTNQTLFLSTNEAMLERARAYLERGFRQLKLRMGRGTPEGDIARLELLRSSFGDEVVLSADLNGTWSREDARRWMPALCDLALDYIEQPLTGDDHEGLIALARSFDLPVMLDESILDIETCRVLTAREPRFMVHLKLAKLGGLDRLAEAVRVARGNGARIMIGQMNEGVLATAATLAAAVALAPERAELYGADRLADDPFEGMTYHAGTVAVAGAFGFGVTQRREIPSLVAGEGLR